MSEFSATQNALNLGYRPTAAGGGRTKYYSSEIVFLHLLAENGESPK